MVLEVGAKALRASRDRLCRGGTRAEEDGDLATACLLFFYAAECGLKERLLVRGGHYGTSALRPTHDLRELAKALHMPRTIGKRLEQLQSCRLHQRARGTVAMADLHQAWRYGAHLHAADEKEAHAVLRELITWCEQDG